MCAKVKEHALTSHQEGLVSSFHAFLPASVTGHALVLITVHHPDQGYKTSFILRIISPPLSTPSFCLPHFKASAHHIFMFLPHLSFDVTHSHLQLLAAVPLPSKSARCTAHNATTPWTQECDHEQMTFLSHFLHLFTHRAESPHHHHHHQPLLTTNGCSDVLSSRECVRVSRFCCGRRSYLSRELQMDMLCFCDSVDQLHLSWREQRICL